MKYEIVQHGGSNNIGYMVIKSAKGAVSPAGYIVRDYTIVEQHCSYKAAIDLQRKLQTAEDSRIANHKLL